jgi:hypothetical protein
MSDLPPPPPPPPYLGETTSQSLRRKLPYYIFGLALGCVLVGLILMLKQFIMPQPPAPTPQQSGSAQHP